MNSFWITLMAVAVMLGYAVPGYILVKRNMIQESAIPAFAKVLMYVCAPCLTIYTLAQTPFSMKVTYDALLVLVVSMVLQVAILLLFRFLFRNRQQEVKYRVCTIATAMGNCGFMGVPLLEAVMPEYPEAVVMSTSFCVGMNFIGWTLSSSIIANDKSYMKIEKALFNPAVISLVVAIPLFVFPAELPTQVNTMVVLLGKMSAPMCMLIMGMRLATMEWKSLFSGYLQYGIIAVKQVAMPLMALGIMSLLPVEENLVKTMYILCAAPVASVVLNFAEMIGEGQKMAANLVLLGTLLSVITIPVMMLVF